MASIITGGHLGLYDSSLNLLGGGVGRAGAGRAGQSDGVYVNSASGNLVLRRQDEYLTALGLDLAVVRTYNSQGLLDDDNGDNWRLSQHRRVYGLTGTVNTAGSGITKVYGDGHEAMFSFDAARGLYVSTDGTGAHDTLSYDAPAQTWTWSPGEGAASETYDVAGRLIEARDADGNTRGYTYTGALLTQIMDALGQSTYFDYTGTNLTQIRTLSQGVEQTRVRYGYDTQNRLEQVIVDLSPEDNSILDANTYVTTYTYDGTSTRVASITQGDTTTVAFAYIEVTAGDWRVVSVTDGAGGITQFAYDTLNRLTDVTDALGQVTTYAYDIEGRLIKMIEPDIGKR